MYYVIGLVVVFMNDTTMVLIIHVKYYMKYLSQVNQIIICYFKAISTCKNTLRSSNIALGHLYKKFKVTPYTECDRKAL